MKPYILIILIILICACTIPAIAVEVSDEDTQTFSMQKGGYVSIIGDEGSITIKSWNGSSVKVKMTKHAGGESQKEAMERLEAIDIDIQHSDSRLSIRQIKPARDQRFSFWDLFDPDRWDAMRSSVRVDFDVLVPKEIELRLETDEGDINARDLMGDISIEVDEGDVNLKNLQFSDMYLKMDEGDLIAEELSGQGRQLTILADEGDIQIEQLSLDKLKIDTDEGDVTIAGSTMERCDIVADEGDVDLELTTKDHGRYTFELDEGDIILELPKQLNAFLRLESEEGDIRTDFKLNIEETEDNGHRARSELGNGGATIDVFTNEGYITLRAR
ncbi:DUF4097 family beta strand repeat protein [candidate division KSB1 bacterium]|nr:DUF4097 family beta strand repeat protein [candidate division KSB1 bacterium]